MKRSILALLAAAATMTIASPSVAMEAEGTNENLRAPTALELPRVTPKAAQDRAVGRDRLADRTPRTWRDQPIYREGVAIPLVTERFGWRIVSADGRRPTRTR